MMAEPVIMPRQGQSVEICVITKWYKQKGDRIEEGDLLYAYETDKAAFEEEAKVSGILLDVFYEEGDEVPVLSTVAVIGDKGESVEEFKSGKPGLQTPEKPVEDIKEQGQKPESTPAPEYDVQYSSKTDIQTPFVKTGEAGEIKISPRAKKLAVEKGVDYLQIKGTGPGGRILERDIRKALEQRPVITPLAREKMKRDKLIISPEKLNVHERITTGDLLRSAFGTEEYIDKPLSRMRKLIAENVYRSLQQSAQVTHHTSADVRNLLDLRRKIKPLAEKGKLPNITLNDMVSYALVRALIKHPEINGHFSDVSIRIFKHVHLGFAVDTERGLMVPVVKNADLLTLNGLSIKIKELAQDCQSGNIDPDLLAAEQASFTLTNLGTLGIEYFTPVLNLPQIGILGVNTIRYQPKEMENGVIGFVPHIGLSLTYDHRAIDGAPASRFLKEVCEEIEHFNPVVEKLD